MSVKKAFDDLKRIGLVPLRTASSKLAQVLALIVAFGASVACNLRTQADQKFGDQHFKTVIALVELYKIRHGDYPEALRDLTFKGDWDAIAISSVEYRKLDDGYELNLVRGWVGKPELNYPPEFWAGLGLKKSNVLPKP